MTDLEPLKSAFVVAQSPDKYILSVQTKNLEVLRFTIEREPLLELNADIVDTILERKAPEQ